MGNRERSGEREWQIASASSGEGQVGAAIYEHERQGRSAEAPAG